MKFNYWVFKNAVPDNICDAIVERGMSETLQEATFLVRGEDNKDDDVRKTNVSWLSDNWIHGIMRHHVELANANYFRLETSTDYVENAQFTVYDKEYHYHWHNDSIEYDEEPNPRKLSAILMLSNPDEYEGGELEVLANFNKDGTVVGEEVFELKERGTIVVFPSTLYHRVKPVTSGRRITLVNWIHGPKLK